MTASIGVYQDDRLAGFFDPSSAVCLGEDGSTEFEVNESGCGAWTELLRLPAGSFVLHERTWDEFEGIRYGRAHLIGRPEAVEWLLQRGIRPPDDLLTGAGLVDFSASGQESRPISEPIEGNNLETLKAEDCANRPRVNLGSRDDVPVVAGNRKRRLTTPQYNVVKALLEAGDTGLSKDELVSESRHEDARGILTRLAEKDADWKAVIHFAGQTGGRYRIK